MKHAIVACLVVVGLSFTAYGQDEPAPQQQPGQPPPTQPMPQPDRQPRQPNVTPFPEPANPNRDRNIFIRGRIIAAPQNVDLNTTEVRLETDGGQRVAFAYTDSSGEFTFQGRDINIDQTLYVVVNVDGFKQHRERIFGGFGGGALDGFLTIFLERETTVTVRPKAGEAIVDLKQLRAKVPGKAVDEYEKAMKESSKGNRAKAVEGLQRAIKLAPDFYEAQHTLGVQFIALQKYDDAENALLRARDLSPKAAEPLINLGSLYYQRGQSQVDAGNSEEAVATFQKSVELLEESIRRNPLSSSAHSYLGAALYKVELYDRAEEILNRALELDEDQHNARLMLINVFTKSGRYADALEQTNIFLTKNPKAPQRPSLEKIKEQLEKAVAK